MVVTTPAHTCASAVTIQIGEHRAYGEWVNAIACVWRSSPLLNICWLVGGCLVGCGMKLQHPFVAAAALVLLRWTRQTFSKYIHPSIALLCTIIL